MSFLREGCRVSYIGDGSDGRSMGDRGRLLVRSGAKGHVNWEDGTCTMHDLDFLAASSGQTRQAAVVPDGLEDSLEVGPITMVGVRGVYDTEGGAGVLNAMATTGVLASFPEIAVQAQHFVAGRIREDPAFHAVVAQLDDDEAEELVALASQALLRDAWGDVDG